MMPPTKAPDALLAPLICEMVETAAVEIAVVLVVREPVMVVVLAEQLGQTVVVTAPEGMTKVTAVQLLLVPAKSYSITLGTL